MSGMRYHKPLHGANGKDKPCFRLLPRLLAGSPANRDETRLNGRDRPARAAIVALHEIQAILLLQRCVGRLARRARYVLAHVPADDLLDGLWRETTLDHHARRSINGTCGPHLSEHERVHMLRGSVECLANLAEIDQHHALGTFTHNLRRLDQEALAISRKLRIVGKQQAIHALEKLLVLILAVFGDGDETALALLSLLTLILAVVITVVVIIALALQAHLGELRVGALLPLLLLVGDALRRLLLFLLLGEVEYFFFLVSGELLCLLRLLLLLLLRKIEHPVVIIKSRRVALLVGRLRLLLFLLLQ
mmetsp:Transcript_33891/g.79353  ORF Transcript_33891/g.79353 Transcript_33891/m.79353 type:complete len:306 (+) Transcript_33891:336-1253(+)